MNLKLDLGFRFLLRLDQPYVPVWPGLSGFKRLSRLAKCPGAELLGWTGGTFRLAPRRHFPMSGPCVYSFFLHFYFLFMMLRAVEGFQGSAAIGEPERQARRTSHCGSKQEGTSR